MSDVRIILLLTAAVLCTGTPVSALLAGQPVLMWTRISKGQSAFALIECGYVSGFSLKTISFVRTPEAITSCPPVSRL